MQDVIYVWCYLYMVLFIHGVNYVWCDLCMVLIMYVYLYV